MYSNKRKVRGQFADLHNNTTAKCRSGFTLFALGHPDGLLPVIILTTQCLHVITASSRKCIISAYRIAYQATVPKNGLDSCQKWFSQAKSFYISLSGLINFNNCYPIAFPAKKTCTQLNSYSEYRELIKKLLQDYTQVFLFSVKTIEMNLLLLVLKPT